MSEHANQEHLYAFKPGVSKNIVICCDGTWNFAEQKDDGKDAPTNVCKIFT